MYKCDSDRSIGEECRVLPRPTVEGLVLGTIYLNSNHTKLVWILARSSTRNAFLDCLTLLLLPLLPWWLPAILSQYPLRPLEPA